MIFRWIRTNIARKPYIFVIYLDPLICFAYTAILVVPNCDLQNGFFYLPLLDISLSKRAFNESLDFLQPFIASWKTLIWLTAAKLTCPCNTFHTSNSFARSDPEASSITRVLSSAHCTDSRLYTLRIKIGTRTTSAREHSRCWTRLRCCDWQASHTWVARAKQASCLLDYTGCSV